MLRVLLLIVTTCFASWVEVGESSAYPKAMYFVGVGSSPESSELAVEKAQAEISRQIKMKIKSYQSDLQESVAKSGRESTWEESSSRTESESMNTLVGTEIVERAQKGELFYAMVVLDKMKFAELHNSKIREANQTLAQLLNDGKKYFAQKELNAGFEVLKQAGPILKSGNESSELLKAVGLLGGDESVVFNQADFNTLVSEVVDGLEFQIEGPLRQELGSLKDWKEVRVRLRYLGEPVPNFNWFLKNQQSREAVEYKAGREGVAVLLPNHLKGWVRGENLFDFKLKLGLDPLNQKRLQQKAPVFQVVISQALCKVDLSYSKDSSEEMIREFESFLLEQGVQIVKGLNPVVIELSSQLGVTVDGLSRSSSLQKRTFTVKTIRGNLNLSLQGEGLGSSLKTSFKNAAKRGQWASKISAELANHCTN